MRHDIRKADQRLLEGKWCDQENNVRMRAQVGTALDTVLEKAHELEQAALVVVQTPTKIRILSSFMTEFVHLCAQTF